jgi:hypothetical protein
VRDHRQDRGGDQRRAPRDLAPSALSRLGIEDDIRGNEPKGAAVRPPLADPV